MGPVNICKQRIAIKLTTPFWKCNHEFVPLTYFGPKLLLLAFCFLFLTRWHQREKTILFFFTKMFMEAKVGKKKWVLGDSKTCTQSVLVSYSKKSVSNNAPLSATYSSRWSNYVIKHKFSLGTNNACAQKVKPSFLYVFGFNQKQLLSGNVFACLHVSLA